MSDGKLEKMEKDFSPQVDALLPETESLTKVDAGDRISNKQTYTDSAPLTIARQTTRSSRQTLSIGKASTQCK